MKSMTGFGRAAAPFAGHELSVQISSVNRRGIEIAVGLPDGRGVAVKIADGSRAGRVVVAAILRELDVDAAACDALGLVPVLGHGERVGEVRAVVS